jgi:hypothetical protein
MPRKPPAASWICSRRSNERRIKFLRHANQPPARSPSLLCSSRRKGALPKCRSDCVGPPTSRSTDKCHQGSNFGLRVRFPQQMRLIPRNAVHCRRFSLSCLQSRRDCDPKPNGCPVCGATLGSIAAKLPPPPIRNQRMGGGQGGGFRLDLQARRRWTRIPPSPKLTLAFFARFDLFSASRQMIRAAF